MNKDIKDIADIKILIDAFYDKVNENELLSPIFNDLVKVNWEKHLPKMYDFWNMILFEVPGYEGFPLRPHLEINSKNPLTSLHFETWLGLFDKTVDELFAGEKATEIKSRARNVGMSWAYKMDYLNKLEA